MSGEIEIARLIALSKKGFPPVDGKFYEKLRKKMKEMDGAIEKAKKDGDEEKRLDMERERENLKNYAYKIYDKRMRSLMVQLSKKISGGKSDLSQFTDEEKDLFRELYDIVEEKRREIMEGQVDIIHEGKFEVSEDSAGKTENTEESPEETEDVKKDMVKKPAEKDGGVKAEEAPEKRGEAVIPLRMLSEEAFVGLDGHYYYPKKGDVLNLPEKIANILLKGGYAERIGI